MISLSERLLTVAAMAEDAARELRAKDAGAAVGIADIGTDHGYLPIVLISRGIADHAIAMDVREGPLARAREHVTEAHLADRIDVRLSDGFAELSSGEAQIAVLSGMGGRLMQKLLAANPPSALDIRQLVLQPQSEARELWRWLRRNGWFTVDERMVYEDGKFYTMLRAVPEDPSTQKTGDDFGAFLSARRDETWRLLLEKELAEKRALHRTLLLKQGNHGTRVAELAAEIADTEAALAVFREDEEEAT